MTHCTSKFYFEKHYSYFLFFFKQEKGVFLLCYWNDLNTVQLMFFYTGMLKFSTLKPVGIFSDFSPTFPPMCFIKIHNCNKMVSIFWLHDLLYQNVE